MQAPSALLKLMYLVSPALPIGAYAYSQGQEWAVDANWIQSEDELCDWWQGLMYNSLAVCDLPILMRLYDAWHQENYEQVRYWDQFLIASRETSELLLEDTQLGIALKRVLETHQFTRCELVGERPSFVTLFALAGVEWQIDKSELLQGWLWSWLENQVAAACKAVPLGQTQAQRMLMRLIDDIPLVIQQASLCEDEDIGAGLPGLALASCLHERQYSRLFRS
ncbi:urease accessory protein UreF [Agaribacterium sp. ZY112]